MQTIKTIIGSAREGKTTKLLEEFFAHLYNEELCKTIKPVFITSDETYDVLKGFAENKLNIHIDFKKYVYEIGDLAKIKNDEIENLFGAMVLSNLDKCDCVFYIDGLDNCIKDFGQKILLLSNCLPNHIIPHSFDVVYTVNRLPVNLDTLATEV